jgi:hypothetical protein
MEAEALAAGDLREGNFEIAAKLMGRAGAAGVVAAGLDAAGQFAVRVFEAFYVVALPALNGDRDLVGCLDCGFAVYVDGGKAVSRYFVCGFNCEFNDVHWGLFLRIIQGDDGKQCAR